MNIFSIFAIGKPAPLIKDQTIVDSLYKKYRLNVRIKNSARKYLPGSGAAFDVRVQGNKNGPFELAFWAVDEAP